MRRAVILAGCCLLYQCACYSQAGNDTALQRKLAEAEERNKIQFAQLTKQITDLKVQLQKQSRAGSEKFVNVAMFLDAALSSANNLQSLIYKESYRNKIASLNNPTSNELGFNLELEIQNALKPLLAKAKKTNTGKVGQVVSSFLNAGKGKLSLFPAGNIFTSIVGLAGNLTVQEKSIDQQDLDEFINGIEKYFNQYERLYQSNVSFNKEMEGLKTRMRSLQSDIKVLIQDIVIAMDKKIKRQQIKNNSCEEMMLKYLDLKYIEQVTGRGEPVSFPQDAIKSCKEIATDLQRIYDDYAGIYNSNFKEIKSIIADTKMVSKSVNQIQLDETLRQLEKLYSESKSMDADNLRLKTVFERLESVVQ